MPVPTWNNERRMRLIADIAHLLRKHDRIDCLKVWFVVGPDQKAVALHLPQALEVLSNDNGQLHYDGPNTFVRNTQGNHPKKEEQTGWWDLTLTQRIELETY